jgi:hypothetical protein
MGIGDGARVMPAEALALADERMAAIASPRFADLEEITVTDMIPIEETGEADTTVIKVHTVTAVNDERVAVPGLGAHMGGRGSGGGRKKVIGGEGMRRLDPLFTAIGPGAEVNFKETTEMAEIWSLHGDRFVVNY